MFSPEELPFIREISSTARSQMDDASITLAKQKLQALYAILPAALQTPCKNFL